MELKLTLGNGVDMVAPQTATATYDLDVAEIRLKRTTTLSP